MLISIHRFNTIPVKIPTVWFSEFYHLIIKFKWKCKPKQSFLKFNLIYFLYSRFLLVIHFIPKQSWQSRTNLDNSQFPFSKHTIKLQYPKECGSCIKIDILINRIKLSPEINSTSMVDWFWQGYQDKVMGIE